MIQFYTNLTCLMTTWLILRMYLVYYFVDLKNILGFSQNKKKKSLDILHLKTSILGSFSPNPC